MYLILSYPLRQYALYLSTQYILYSRYKLWPLLLLRLDPACELASLLANVNKTRSRLQNAERIPAVVLLDLTTSSRKTSLSFTLNLSSPFMPLDRSKLRGAHNQTQNDNECRYQSFNGDIDWERMCCKRLRLAMVHRC